MRRAGLLFFALALTAALPAEAYPGGAPGQQGTSGAWASGAAEPPVFTLASNLPPAPPSQRSYSLPAGPALLEPGALAAPEIGPEALLPVLDLRTSAPVVSLSVFLGRGGGDIFATLHQDYAWRMTFKSMTLGLGIFREIPLARGIGIQPYLGVIRSSATLRPSDLYGGRGAFEYRLTVLSVGLPLVLRFN